MWDITTTWDSALGSHMCCAFMIMWDLTTTRDLSLISHCNTVFCILISHMYICSAFMTMWDLITIWDLSWISHCNTRFCISISHMYVVLSWPCEISQLYEISHWYLTVTRNSAFVYVVLSWPCEIPRDSALRSHICIGLWRHRLRSTLLAEIGAMGREIESRLGIGREFSEVKRTSFRNNCQKYPMYKPPHFHHTGASPAISFHRNFN
jgi:hypothetical protein